MNFNDDKTVVYRTEDGDQYTPKDFLEICGGVEPLAKRVYQECTWQHPETILEELSNELDELPYKEVVEYCEHLSFEKLVEVFSFYGRTYKINIGQKDNIIAFAKNIAVKEYVA
jgi:hypothetical protein